MLSQNSKFGEWNTITLILNNLPNAVIQALYKIRFPECYSEGLNISGVIGEDLSSMNFSMIKENNTLLAWGSFQRRLQISNV